MVSQLKKKPRTEQIHRVLPDLPPVLFDLSHNIERKGTPSNFIPWSQYFLDTKT
jgi:hypothetical protein